MNNGIAVDLRNVVKRFADVCAVDHVSMQIRDGGLFSMLGPSGCDKTTTLRMIAGFEFPTSGEITANRSVIHRPFGAMSTPCFNRMRSFRI